MTLDGHFVSLCEQLPWLGCVFALKAGTIFADGESEPVNNSHNEQTNHHHGKHLEKIDALAAKFDSVSTISTLSLFFAGIHRTEPQSFVLRLAGFHTEYPSVFLLTRWCRSCVSSIPFYHGRKQCLQG